MYRTHQGRCTETAEQPDIQHWKRVELRVRTIRTTSPTFVDIKSACKLSSQSVLAVNFGWIFFSTNSWTWPESGRDLETLKMTDLNVLGTQLLAGNMFLNGKFDALLIYLSSLTKYTPLRLNNM